MEATTPGSADPHANAPVLSAGTGLAQARAAMILVHGRGAGAEDILSLTAHLPDAAVAYLAPQAADHTWYPHRFLEPLARNEPYLSSALALLNRLVARVEAAGLPAARVGLLGFSQGACLALDYVARHPRRYGCAIGFSGGLIGPARTIWPHTGSLDGTPVFLGCSDRDAHIPAARVEETAAHLAALGAAVDLRLYPGMGHTINEDEVAAAGRLIAAMTGDD